jgi:hypothetical protein
LNLFVAITGLPPGKFSLTSPGTKIPGQVSPPEYRIRAAASNE